MVDDNIVQLFEDLIDILTKLPAILAKLVENPEFLKTAVEFKIGMLQDEIDKYHEMLDKI